MRKRQLPATPMQSGPPQSSLTQFTPTPSGMAQMPPPSSLFPSRPGAGTPPAAAAVPRHSRWNPPLLGNLPSDFLRVVPAKTTQVSTAFFMDRYKVPTIIFFQYSVHSFICWNLMKFHPISVLDQ